MYKGLLNICRSTTLKYTIYRHQNKYNTQAVKGQVDKYE